MHDLIIRNIPLVDGYGGPAVSAERTVQGGGFVQIGQGQTEFAA